MGFALDGGIYMHIVMDMPLDMTITFACVPVVNLWKLSEDAYTMNVSTTGMAERDLMLTFDFTRDLLDQLSEQISTEEAEVIRQQLLSQPFVYRGDASSPRVHITCMQTTDIKFSQSGEMFIPLKVTKFKKA
jgi:hypothetical protein